MRIRGYKGKGVRGYDGYECMRVRGYKGKGVRGYDGYECMRVRGYKGKGVRGYDGYECMRIQEYEGQRGTRVWGVKRYAVPVLQLTNGCIFSGSHRVFM